VKERENSLTKKKSIDLEDLEKDARRVGAILTDVGEKVQSINGTSEDWNATEPTMELRWHYYHDNKDKGIELQQYHRYLHKEGGEWRDVPTV
jgi:hypothetical protein